MLSRSVYWVWFPLLTALFIIIRLLHHALADIWQSMVINCGFLLLQLVFVSAWFSLKKGSWVNITSQLLGWGDILFLLSIAFYLSVINFLFFYIASLIGGLVCWGIWQAITGKKDKHIPLAGIQAFIFTIFLANDWWLLHLNLTDDTWLLHLITK